MNLTRCTVRGALLAAPAILLLTSPAFSGTASIDLETPELSQDETPKPRTIPKPKPAATPPKAGEQKPAEQKPQANKPSGRTLPALDEKDPDYAKKVEK